MRIDPCDHLGLTARTMSDEGAILTRIEIEIKAYILSQLYEEWSFPMLTRDHDGFDAFVLKPLIFDVRIRAGSIGHDRRTHVVPVKIPGDVTQRLANLIGRKKAAKPRFVVITAIERYPRLLEQKIDRRAMGGLRKVCELVGR
ncbi:hypothetical protein D2V17_19010 [Aurantiacibacter xanthus]|uniref:Uncharacterized protein n=1 Tax=Aurantiacibacter xanthus TaxID=1784712 RepID=A0A3A1P3Q9_9SPHN|nr:hypothetical protein D2V17_19010 [Aurantiacibacter xanthus]